MRTLNATLTALILFVITPASSADLKPLSEVLSDENSAAITVYTFTRRGGLYITLAAVAHNAAPVQAKVLQNQSAKAMLIAYKITKKGDKAGPLLQLWQPPGQAAAEQAPLWAPLALLGRVDQV